jgi:hypothetical protein
MLLIFIESLCKIVACHIIQIFDYDLQFLFEMVSHVAFDEEEGKILSKYVM